MENDKFTYILTEGFIDSATKEISEDEFSLLNANRNILLALRDIEDLFALVITAFSELEKFLLTSCVDYRLDNFTEEGNFDRFFDIFHDRLNLHLMTFLNAARAYEEQTYRRLNSITIISPEFSFNPKGVFSKAFDQSIEYRIMYNLRNYGLHDQLPLHGITFSSHNQWRDGKPDSDQPSRGRLTVDPYFLSKDLAFSDKINKKVGRDIEKLGCTKLDLKFLLRSYVSQLGIIQNNIRSNTENLLTTSLEKLYEARNSLAEENNVEKIIDLEIWKTSGDSILDKTYIGPTKLGRVAILRKRWVRLEYTYRLFITSEVILRDDTYPSDNQGVYLIT